MTLKSLFSDISLIWDAIKKKIWFLFITCIAFFFALPVYTVMLLQNLQVYTTENNYTESIINSLKNLLGPASPGNLLLITGFAFLAGMVFFAYIHSKRKVDFYHALPVTRIKLFFINYLAGALSVIIPFVIFYLISVFIIGIFGDLVYIRKLVLLQGLIIPVLYFFAVYSLVVLAAALTGNIVLQGCISLYIILVVPIALFEYNGLMESFFSTYAGMSGILDKLLMYSSPCFNMLLSFNYMNYGVIVFSKLIPLIFYGIIGCVLAAVLYDRRPSESASKAVAFKWFAPLVKYPLVVMGSIGFGLFFYSVNTDYGYNIVWLIFGVIVGGLLVNRVIEVILASDIRAVKGHWLNLIVTLVITGCILSFFVFDLLKYDQYLPSSNQVETVRIDISGANVYGEGIVKYDGTDEDTNSYFSTYSLSNVYELKDKENIEATLAIAANGIDNLETHGYTAEDYKAAQDNIEAGVYNSSTQEVIESPQCFVVIEYFLKNGRQVSRIYNYVDKQATLEAVETILGSQEFKEKRLCYLDRDAPPYQVLYFETDYTISDSMLDSDSKERLKDAYKKDAYALTVADMKGKKVVGYMDFYKYSGGDDISVSAPIYESYENTLSVLSELGYSLADFGTVNPERVTNISKMQSNNDTGAYEEVEKVLYQNYAELLNNTRSDSEFGYNYFIFRNDASNYSYLVDGTLSNNKSYSVYRSTAQNLE